MDNALSTNLISYSMWSMMKNTTDFMFVKDKNYVYIGASEAFAVDCAGLSSVDELVGKTDYEIFEDSVIANKYREDDEKLFQSGFPMMEYTEEYPNQNGRKRYCYTTKYLITDEYGNPSGILGKCQDVTDQVEFERMQQVDYNVKITSALNNMFFTSYYCDLVQKTYIPLKETVHSQKMLSNVHNLQEAFERFIDVLVKEPMIQQMKRFCDLDTLQNRLKGETYISCEYDSKLGDGWRQVGFLPVDFNESGDVTHALFVVSILDADKASHLENEKDFHEMMEIQKKAAQLVSSSEILSVVIIDKETGMTRTNTTFNEISREDEYPLEELVQMEAPFVVEMDREQFTSKVQLQNLVTQVETQGHYKVAVSLLDEKGKYYYIIHHYSDFGDGKHILSVEEDATAQSSLDLVTGSINRRGFLKRAKIHIRNGRDGEYAILYFNIQKFKAINSWYGFDVGDRVLKEVAEWIKASTMKPFLICRESADNFVCLIARERLDEAEIERICHFEVEVGNLQVPVLLQCGIYPIPNAKEDIDIICDKARMACNASAEQKEGSFCVYQSRFNKDYMEQAYILQNFETALKEHQFNIVYQPIYSTVTGKIVSAEALIRWEHPEYGMLSPAAFLPVLEQSGHISEIDQFVVENAWKMQKNRHQHQKPMVPVSVNFSRYDFLQKKYMCDILIQLQEEQELKKYLRFEITENGLDEIQTDGKEFLQMLHESGCKLLVDDFGSGYSSLGMVSQFECDIIKLDMSFTRSIGKSEKAEVIIAATIKTIHDLNLQVVAEGVESEEQFLFLRENGCDFIQGYFFSKPVSGEEFERMLDEEEN